MIDSCEDLDDDDDDDDDEDGDGDSTFTDEEADADENDDVTVFNDAQSKAHASKSSQRTQPTDGNDSGNAEC